MKYLMFKKSRNIRIKDKIDGKTNLYSFCINCGFKKIESIDEEELSYLLETLI